MGMTFKHLLAAAAASCGLSAIAAPGAYSTWFDNAVPSYGTQNSGWTTSTAAMLADDVLTLEDCTDGVCYTPTTEAAKDYQKQTITISSEAVDWADLPTIGGDTLTSAKFAVCLALPADSDTPVFAAYTAAGWVEVESPVPSEENSHTIVIEYNKTEKTFTITEDSVTSEPLSAAGSATAISSTTIVGTGSVSLLSGKTAGPAAATINGVGYDSLAEAIEAGKATAETPIVLAANATLPESAGAYKINTNGFALNSPSGYFATIDGVNVTVAATSATAPDASMIWNRDFVSGRVDANGNNWSFYKPNGATITSEGVTLGSDGGLSLLNRTKNPGNPTGTMSVIFRAKNIRLPSSDQAVLARFRQGDMTLGASISNAGFYTRVWTESNLDWNSKTDAPALLAAEDVEQTYVLTYVYGSGTAFYRVDGDRTVTKLWTEGGLRSNQMNAFTEVSILGKREANSCAGATITGVAVFEGTSLSAEAIANFTWNSAAPNKTSYAGDQPPYAYYGYIPADAKMIWPGLTLDAIKDLMFAGTLNGNWIAADNGVGAGTIGGWSNRESVAEKTVASDSIILDFQSPGETKYIRVTLTEADGGIKAAAVASTSKGGTGSVLASDDNVGNYGIKVLRATRPVARIVGGDDFATLAAAIEAAGTPTEESPVTIQLLQASSEAVTIPANVTVDVNGQTFTGTVAGAGKLQVAGFSAISSATNLKNSLKNAQWTGTLVVTQPATGGINDGAVSNNNTTLNEYGNVDSKIEFLDCTYDGNSNLNYFGLTTTDDATVVKPEVIITGVLKLRNGFSDNGSNGYKTIFRKVSGTGTILCPRTDLGPRLYFVDGSDFRGTINTQGYKFYFGAREESDPAPATGAVIVKSGAEVTIDTGKTWTAAGGVTVNGTLNMKGATASAVKGSGTVIYTSAPTADAATAAGYTANDWTGTVWLQGVGQTGNNKILEDNLLNKLGHAGSTVKLTDCNGYISTNNGAFGFDVEVDGAGWKNPSGGSGLTRTFGALKGSGILDGAACDSRKCKEINRFTDASAFTGTINAGKDMDEVQGGTTNWAGKRFVIGSENPEDVSGLIHVSAGQSVTVAAGKTWTANTICVKGTMTVEAGAALDCNNLKLGAVGAKIVSSQSITGIVSGVNGYAVTSSTVEGVTTYTLTLDATEITPTEGGLVINVAGITIKKGEETITGSTIPNDTGVYTVKKDDATIAEVAVIKVKDAETGDTPAMVTTAVAVPFASLSGGAVTVDALLNKALLNEGDQLMVWTGSAYNAWQLTEGKAWEGVAVVKGTGDNQVTIATAGGADSTVLPRGSAVWVKSAGKVVVYGTLSSSATPAITTGVNLLGNTAMAAATPTAMTGDIVEIPGDTTGVRQYEKTATGWTGTKLVVTYTGETIAGLPVKESKTETTHDAPSVSAGRGYFLKRP